MGLHHTFPRMGTQQSKELVLIPNLEVCAYHLRVLTLLRHSKEAAGRVVTYLERYSSHVDRVFTKPMFSSETVKSENSDGSRALTLLAT